MKPATRKGAPVKRGGGELGHGFQPGTSGHSNGLIVQVKAPETATLTIATAQGKATIALAELATGGVHASSVGGSRRGGCPCMPS